MIYFHLAWLFGAPRPGKILARSRETAWWMFWFIDIIWIILVALIEPILVLYLILIICFKTILILDIGVVVVIMITTMKSPPLSREGKSRLGEPQQPRPHKVKTPGNLEEI